MSALRAVVDVTRTVTVSAAPRVAAVGDTDTVVVQPPADSAEAAWDGDTVVVATNPTASITTSEVIRRRSGKAGRVLVRGPAARARRRSFIGRPSLTCHGIDTIVTE